MFIEIFLNLIFYGSYLIFLMLIVAVILLFNKAKNQKAIKKRGKIFAGIFIIFALFFIYARFAEPQMLKVRRERVFSDFEGGGQVNTIKMAIFSDLHYGIFKNAKSLKEVVDKINLENPDLVLIPGDFVYHLAKEKIERELAEIKNINAPVFAVLGNHDYGIEGEEDVSEKEKAALESFGVNVLENKSEKIAIKGRLINIIGIKDYWTNDADYNLLKEISKDEFTIVLTHNADSVYDFPEAACLPDLVISGHTHGGQMRVPFIYKFMIPSERGFDKGFYLIKGMKIFITSGVGMDGLPLRFLCPPEINILEI
ncbi:MAG: metallophosphoesterase [bacterium]